MLLIFWMKGILDRSSDFPRNVGTILNKEAPAIKLESLHFIGIFGVGLLSAVERR
jgi:hypothetical protein